MKSARFFALDARAAFPFLFVLINVHIWTIVLALITTFIFWIGERLGLQFDSALRAARAWFVIPIRPGQAFQLNHRMADLSGIEAIEPPVPPPGKKG